jgi:hypothetical protein
MIRWVMGNRNMKVYVMGKMLIYLISTRLQQIKNYFNCLSPQKIPLPLIIIHDIRSQLDALLVELLHYPVS